MNIQSRKRWVDYSRAKDKMFAHMDTKKSPWYVVNADNKKRARLNCITHLLRQVPYHDMTPVEFDLPPRQSTKYKRPKLSSQRFVPRPISVTILQAEYMPGWTAHQARSEVWNPLQAPVPQYS